MSYADVAKAYRQAENEKIRMNPSARYMTLRDYFAAKAMQSMVQAWISTNQYPSTDSEVAVNAYAVADAMLKARN